jgi:hypothetical protein
MDIREARENPQLLYPLPSKNIWTGKGTAGIFKCTQIIRKCMDTDVALH